MSSPRDNSFSRDSISDRLERLEAIQNHHAETSPLMPDLKPDVAAWMQHCYTEYRTMITDAKINDDGSRSLTGSVQEAKDALTEQLGYAKMHILAFYTNDDKRRRSYGIEGEMPWRSDALLNLADEIIRLSARDKAENISYCIGDTLLQRLQEAIDGLRAARKERKVGNADEKGAYGAAGQRFSEDTDMLNKLYATWVGALGKKDTRILLIGMVNVQQGGNSGYPGIPTLVIDPVDRAIVITPDANRPAPTSYQTQFREVGSADWEDFANGSDNRIPTAVALLNAGNDYEFRTRAHNANGYGEWSAVIVRGG